MEVRAFGSFACLAQGRLRWIQWLGVRDTWVCSPKLRSDFLVPFEYTCLIIDTIN